MYNKVLDRRRKRGRSHSSGGYSGFDTAVFMDTASSNHVFIDVANATFPRLSHNITLNDMRDLPPPIVVTAHGCLLIPAAFFAWWYWTKRTTRRLVRGLLTYARGGAPMTVDRTTLGMTEASILSNPFDHTTSLQSKTTDQSHDPDIGLPEDSSSDSSTTFRFIRWLKGTKSSRVRHKVRTATRQNLHSPDLGRSKLTPNPSEMITADHARTLEVRPTESMVFANTGHYDNTYEDIMAVELCSLDESNPLHPSIQQGKTVVIHVETIPYGETV
jgi:hypothetical protein